MKQFNLTAGRSLPEWLDERKRRTLLKKDVELRRRLELLQDFAMPCVSTNVKISNDGDYVLATGTYKPRVRCYDVNQLGLKFERCFDSEPIAFSVLSDDYSKLVFLQCDRHVELHAQFGRYYRLRVPKFGRDLAYHPSNCDLYVVGDGSDVHRLNLEQGRFLNPLTTGSTGLNVCKVNDDHHMFVCGSVEGQVEAWDPRSRQKSGVLDCALALVQGDHLESNDSLPQVTSLAFKDGLNMAVGTSTGHVLLYDIRSSRPLLVKDHQYGLPIKSLLFHSTLDHVVSLDAKAVKIWDRSNGKPYTTIESEAELNEVCSYPGSGLMFMSTEQPKLQVHYVPSMGPAPKWCSFLDNITEEIEESAVSAIYDDYKFVTKTQLSDLGLDHLVGSSLLRAYMHGYFMDARLYRKAQSLVQPYTLDNFLKDKIDKKLEEQRTKRVQLKEAFGKNLPKSNKELFVKLKKQEIGEANSGKKKKQKEAAANLLADDRFKELFTDERFQVDTNEETYRLLNPVLSKLEEPAKTSDEKKSFTEKFNQVDSDPEDSGSDNNDFIDNDDESEEESSDDDQEWTKRIKEQHKKLRVEAAIKKREDNAAKLAAKISAMSKPKFNEIKDGESLQTNGAESKRRKKVKSLEERLEQEPEVTERHDGHQMVFQSKKSKRQLQQEAEAKRHRQERQELRRSASGLKKDRIAPKFWMGKRVV